VLSASAQAKHIATYSLARSSNGTKMVSRQRERELLTSSEASALLEVKSGLLCCTWQWYTQWYHQMVGGSRL